MTIETLMPDPNGPGNVLEEFNDYCRDHSIYVSPYIVPQRYPGRGLGIYAQNTIKKGEKLIHVPTKALFTSQSVPKTFLPRAVRKQLTVHCLLAAYLAFGKDDTLAKYERWIATWPTLEDFTESMPIFGLQDLRGTTSLATPGDGSLKQGQRNNKRRKILDRVNGKTSDATMRSADTTGLPGFTRSPGVDNVWLTLPHLTSNHMRASALTKQAEKIRDCVSSIDRHFPDLKIRDPDSTAAYLKFVHMWSCVSTRCFYYLHPGQSPPEDSNEAIALCPFQDLFNHGDAAGCHVQFDKDGSYVTADKEYKVGEELFLNYGRHSNDVLWIEYGFTMGQNRDDHLKIDDSILEGVDAVKRKMLQDAGYLGDYSLESNGVCYRTIMVSYLGVLDDGQWQRVIAGGQPDPEVSTVYRMKKLAAKRKIVEWVLQVCGEAKHNLRALKRVSLDSGEKALLDMWVMGTTLSESQQRREVQLQLAQTRMRMCTTRWLQIFDLCMSALRAIEHECPGAYVQAAKRNRRIEDLNLDAARFFADLVETESS